MHGPDLSFLFKEINFLILIGLLFFLLRRPVREYFASRASSIRVAVDEARRAYSLASDEHEKISGRLQKIDEEREELFRAFREEGEIERKKILEQADEFREKLKGDVQKVAASELKRAKEELKTQSIQLSKELAVKMLKEKLSEKTEAKLASSTIEQIRRIQ